MKLTDLNRGCNITAIVGPVTYEYSLGHGEWFVPHDMRKHYGDELLDKLNQKGGTPIMGYVVQKPTVGRIVHYRSYGTPNGEYLPEVRAAIITAVSGDNEDIRVSLCVLNPTGMFFAQKVSYSVSTPGCWSWPPRA